MRPWRGSLCDSGALVRSVFFLRHCPRRSVSATPIRAVGTWRRRSWREALVAGTLRLRLAAPPPHPPHHRYHRLPAASLLRLPLRSRSWSPAWLYCNGVLLCISAPPPSEPARCPCGLPAAAGLDHVYSLLTCTLGAFEINLSLDEHKQHHSIFITRTVMRLKKIV